LEYEWYVNQGICTCSIVRPPCSFCERGYNIPFDEWLEYQKEIRYPQDKKKQDFEDRYDRAMKGLF
jgi:endogenous inhibitor of DNA gyrase (YacG/DUF329 family)